MDDLKIPIPRSRASFKDFLDAMKREHKLCMPITGSTALKAWKLRQADATWKVTLVCDACGGFSLILSEADLATLNACDPEWLTAPPSPCDEEDAG